jgi:hypothetical protein
MKAILLIFALSPIFISGNKGIAPHRKSLSKDISYYWFDTSLNYLRQNTIGIESAITGYTTSTANPKTLREKGYNPVNCTGTNPPVPNDPSSPDVLLYSHP